jgi:hypothetical protein
MIHEPLLKKKKSSQAVKAILNTVVVFHHRITAFLFIPVRRCQTSKTPPLCSFMETTLEAV